MDEATGVLERLATIEALDRAGAPAAELLDHLRLLVAEAETWARAEGGEAGEEAVSHLRSALALDPAADMIAV